MLFIWKVVNSIKVDSQLLLSRLESGVGPGDLTCFFAYTGPIASVLVPMHIYFAPPLTDFCSAWIEAVHMYMYSLLFKHCICIAFCSAAAVCSPGCTGSLPTEQKAEQKAFCSSGIEAVHVHAEWSYEAVYIKKKFQRDTKAVYICVQQGRLFTCANVYSLVLKGL